MGRKTKSSDLDIIGYILIAPFFLIWGIVIFIQKIVAKNTEKQATKLNDKIKQIQLYKAVVSNVSLKEYINQIKRKKFEQNSFYNVEFSSEGVNFYTESGVFDSLHYKQIFFYQSP